MGVDLECVRVNNDNIIFWWIFPLDFMKDFRHAVKVKTIWIVSSSLLMWHRLFPALSKCELYIEHCCRYWTLFSSICPLSVSLINDFNYRHCRSSCVHLVVTFGRSCHGWEKKETKKRSLSSRGCWNRLGNNQPLPVSQLYCQLTSLQSRWVFPMLSW